MSVPAWGIIVALIVGAIVGWVLRGRQTKEVVDDARDARRYRALRGEPERGASFAPIVEAEDGDASVGIFNGWITVTYGWTERVPKVTTLDDLADALMSERAP